MKKLLAIVAIFCFATIITNAEPIQDNSFKEFFKEFQKNLKESNWRPNIWDLREYMDYSMFKRNCNTEEFDNMMCDYLPSLTSFIEMLGDGYKDICKLSEKNNYEIVKKNKKMRITLGIYCIKKDEWNNQYLEIHETNVLYCLYWNKSSLVDDDEFGVSCMFAKIKGQWKIVDFKFAG